MKLLQQRNQYSATARTSERGPNIVLRDGEAVPAFTVNTVSHCAISTGRWKCSRYYPSIRGKPTLPSRFRSGPPLDGLFPFQQQFHECRIGMNNVPPGLHKA